MRAPTARLAAPVPRGVPPPRAPAKLPMNEAVIFTRDNWLAAYGFDLNEKAAFTWTNAPAAGFQLALGPTPPGTVLCLAVRPFVQPPHLALQTLQIFLNGLYNGYRILTGPEALKLPIHRDAHRLRIDLVLPLAASPKSLGASQDARTLGVAITSVALR